MAGPRIDVMLRIGGDTDIVERRGLQRRQQMGHAIGFARRDLRTGMRHARIEFERVDPAGPRQKRVIGERVAPRVSTLKSPSSTLTSPAATASTSGTVASAWTALTAAVGEGWTQNRLIVRAAPPTSTTRV